MHRDGQRIHRDCNYIQRPCNAMHVCMLSFHILFRIPCSRAGPCTRCRRIRQSLISVVPQNRVRSSRTRLRSPESRSDRCCLQTRVLNFDSEDNIRLHLGNMYLRLATLCLKGWGWGCIPWRLGIPSISPVAYLGRFHWY